MIARLVAVRLSRALATLLAVSLVVFASLEVLPGSYARNVLGQSATDETVLNLERRLGLDQPAWLRYIRWIGGAATGDLGNAYSGSDTSAPRRVTDILAPRLRNTFFLAGLAAIVAVPVALAAGLVAALYRHRWLDRLLNTSSLAVAATPEFVIAYAVMFIFAIKLGWLKPLSTLAPGATLGELTAAAALPAATLALGIIAHMLRMTRAAVIDILSRTYIETARLKGLSDLKVIVRHALPNAWAPIGMVIAFNLAYLVVGVVVVEAVFTYPGVGQLLVDAVTSRDMPIVQACILLFATVYIALNMLAEIIAIVTNPRLLHPR